MGLGPGFRRTRPGEYAASNQAAASLVKYPAVPLPGLADDGPSDATRLLCAAAHLRPRGKWWAPESRRRAVERVAPKRVHDSLQKRRERAALDSATEEEATEMEPSPKEKSVPIGLDYARWVRQRVLSGQRPVPSHGFDLGEVAASCAQAARLGRQRTELVALSLAAGLLWAWLVDPYWAAVVALLGMWLSFYADRVRAQRLLRHVMGVDDPGLPELRQLPPGLEREVRRIHDLEGQPVIPYQTEPRTGRVRYHFLGAGKVWFESTVGIDVMPTVPKDQDASANTPPDAISWLLPSTDRLLSGRDPGSGVRAFTPDHLIDHLQRELQRPIRPDRDFHPDSRQDVFGIATLSADRWPGLSQEQWAALVTLAHEGVHAIGAHKAPKVARRFLCARMVSWDGEVVASVFISVAYENHFLRVIVRPQVLNPAHPAITAARRQASRTGWPFHRGALWYAAIDTKTALWQAISPPSTRSRRPDLDPRGSRAAVVSLREIYSARYMDDMLQYDDARRYTTMMQRRVFAAVQGFLVDHNVDTAAYQAQVTVILNSGVINSGEMGNVQNQPGSAGSQQSQGGT